jgi:hypothetical protein
MRAPYRKYSFGAGGIAILLGGRVTLSALVLGLHRAIQILYPACLWYFDFAPTKVF